MPKLVFKNTEIRGISACVPKDVVKNSEYGHLLAEETLRKLIATTGINERRISGSNVCSSDLAYEAACKLISDLNISKESIDILIFVTQTPDYKIPGTGHILQQRLGLPKSTGVFDINQGCSGYVYGLSMAYAFVQQEHIKRILLLVADTPTKFVSPTDRSAALLFGDAGTATLIEKSSGASPAYFSINSDGAGAESLMIKAGSYRNPASTEPMTGDSMYLYMNGPEVFNFTIREVPSDVTSLLETADCPLEQVDHLVFHQANKFITDFLSQKLKFPLTRVPYSLPMFGNTSCSSIPLTMVVNLREQLMGKANKLILAGFGIGLSWASALLDVNKCHIPELIEI